MKKVYVEKLAVPPLQALSELEPVYQALRSAAERANDLHAYMSAELTLASMDCCRYALAQPQCYIDKPHYLVAEPEDEPSMLFRERCRFVYNGAIG